MIGSFGAPTRQGAALRLTASALGLVIVPVVGLAFFGGGSPLFVVFLGASVYLLWVLVADGLAVVRSARSGSPTKFSARRRFLIWFLIGFVPAALWLTDVVIRSEKVEPPARPPAPLSLPP